MMNDNLLMLAVPAFAVIAVLVTTAFTYYRVMRHGRVFNWPAQPPRAAGDGRKHR